jgi:hypothetical protein
LTVDPVDIMGDMPRSSTQPPLVAERAEMSDQERAKRLAELAELIVDPTWLDREALEDLEKREDEPR